jgi:hypothetical protein
MMFDTPNYRQWFDGLAQFIPEDTVSNAVRNITKILKGNPMPVTNDEIDAVKERFNWQTIVQNFWERCR